MFLARVYLISAVLVVASAAPRRTARSTVPMWHLPCGDELDVEVTSWEDFDREAMDSLENLRLQHQLTMNDYQNRDYNFLYERVHHGVDDHQYIPDWLPDRKEREIVRRLTDANLETIVNHLPMLHKDLQKFAVAFEELIEDEFDLRKKQALKGTQSYLKSMLCELENNILALPSLKVPKRVERSIMNSTQRDLVDDTNRLVRDWGVILRYGKYLRAWRHVFKY